MDFFHRYTFTLAPFLFVVCLIADPVATRPTTTAPTPFANTDATRTVKTTQVVTIFGGNTTEICTFIASPTTTVNGGTAVVISKNCSIMSSSGPPSTSVVSTFSTTGPTVPHPTIISSTSHASIGAVSFSTFTPMSTNTVLTDESSSASPTSIPTPGTIAQATNSVNAPSDSTTSSLPTSESSTSSSNPFTATAQSHLSSLPIFLGAFGGIAGLALLVVTIKVYRPCQRFGEMRLHPSALARRMNIRSGFVWGKNPWRRSREHDNEKLTGRASQETQQQSSPGEI